MENLNRIWNFSSKFDFLFIRIVPKRLKLNRNKLMQKIILLILILMSQVIFSAAKNTETQRIGIIPDIEIKTTIKGIQEGKDEVLDRALLFIETGK